MTNNVDNNADDDHCLGAKAALFPPRLPLGRRHLGRTGSVPVGCQHDRHHRHHRQHRQQHDRHHKHDHHHHHHHNSHHQYWPFFRWGARESIRERFKELGGEAADRYFRKKSFQIKNASKTSTF